MTNTISKHIQRVVQLVAVLLLIAGCTADTTPSPTGPWFVMTDTPAQRTNTPMLSTTPASPTAPTGSVVPIPVGQGFGASKGFWQVYFTAPTGSRDATTYRGGLDDVLAAQIDQVQQTLDIAAYEFNSPALTQAILAAKNRGVRVRIVTDDDDGLGDDETTLNQFVAAGIPVVTDNRSALMHDKFMILDSTVVWTGSWNYTINDTYRNNKTPSPCARKSPYRITRPSSTRCSSTGASVQPRLSTRHAPNFRRMARRLASTLARKTT